MPGAWLLRKNSKRLVQKSNGGLDCIIFEGLSKDLMLRHESGIHERNLGQKYRFGCQMTYECYRRQ